MFEYLMDEMFRGSHRWRRIAAVRMASTPVLTARYAGLEVRRMMKGTWVRSYHDAIDVRRGLIGGQEVPAEFMWRHRLWVVREIVSHWIETGAWWEQSGVAALFEVTSGGCGGSAGRAASGADRIGVDLLGEREYWRVDARRPRAARGGVFDLAYDQADGQWHLVCALD